MLLPVPKGLSEWWDQAIPDEPLQVALRWRDDRELEVGTLHSRRMLFQFDARPDDFTRPTGPERVGRLAAKAFTRAGWRRPAIDPLALLRLLALRRSGTRVEFILDTNALVEGIAHFLVDFFADRCDLVVTPVTLRELQDAQEQFGLKDRRGNPVKDPGKPLGKRQL